jgi:NAD(P)-dependent dehydrogenase (short-subunit alcohol dehydrogenase family)
MTASHPFSLAGRMVLVTGASSGIGAATAVACSRMGATLIVAGRDAANLEATRASLHGDGHRAVQGDLTRAHDLAALAEATGPVDGVVHCAGVRGLAPIRMVSERFVRDVFAVNFEAPVLLTQRLLYRNRIRDGGAIVFLSSSSAHLGMHGVGIYSASKAALRAVARCLALEQAKRRIRVNCLSPDLVETRLLRDVPQVDGVDTWLEEQRERHPLGLGKPDDVANAIIYLLSGASRWVTGQTIIMDGGVTF